MEEGIRKEVEERFLKILDKIKNIYDFEIVDLNLQTLKDEAKIVVENQQLYEDWLENVESLPLPSIVSISRYSRPDGEYLNVLYQLKSDRGNLNRKIKIKSNGNVKTYSYITFKDEKNNLEVNVEYDTYGNLIFSIKKAD